MKKKKRKYHLTKPHKDTLKRIKRDREIYQFYIDFLAKNGRVPTLREIGKHFGFSRARAGQVMQRLWKEGYVLKAKKYHSPYVPITGYGKGRKIKIIKP